jgi:CDP-paratose 2-epimerase
MARFEKVLVTGSSGLIGSEAVAFYSEQGSKVYGVDNNMRRDFFGPDGDTTWNLRRLQAAYSDFVHIDKDVRDRAAINALIAEIRPDVLVHCAAQPSHDLAKDRPFDDFDVNAVGTLNLLEACRKHCPESPFLFMSTNKVYGDAPNELPLVELETRWDYAREEDREGISEQCRIDASTHSLFGASKAAADVMAQEYGRYFGMPVGIFRGGCLTGSGHSGAELHGFLAYLIQACLQGRRYRIFGYKGKQVRDNIDSYDVMTALNAFAEEPRPGEPYNLGGTRRNSISMLEAIDKVEKLVGKRLATEYVEQNRIGDHICYISDMRKFKSHYPGWSITRSVDAILEDMVKVARARFS